MLRSYHRGISRLCKAVTLLAGIGFVIFAVGDIFAYFRSENPIYLDQAKETLSAAIGSAALYLFVHLSGKVLARSD